MQRFDISGTPGLIWKTRRAKSAKERHAAPVGIASHHRSTRTKNDNVTLDDFP